MVVIKMAISTLGRRGARFCRKKMMAKAARPNIRVGQWVLPSCCITIHRSPRKNSVRGIGTLISLLSSDKPMINAAALVKPMITGCERKFTTSPRRKNPMASRRMPTISASMMERVMKSSLPTAA